MSKPHIAMKLVLSGTAVTSVNGMYGPSVQLNAAAVGADPAGTAATAITAALVTYATQNAVAAGDAATLLSAQTYATNSTNVLATTISGQLANKADLVDGVLATSQIPAQALTQFLNAVNSQSEMLALTGQSGDWCIRADIGMAYIITAQENTGLLSDWTALPQVASPVTSVNGQVGVIVLSYADVGAEQAGAVAALQAALQPQIDTKADASAVIAALANKLDVTGNAVSATKLETARTITLTGAVSGSVSFDGSTNVSITTTGGGSIEWADVTKVPATLAFGFAADNTHPLQVGKDADGNVYVKGVIRNTGGSSIAGFADIMTVPATHKFKWMTSSSHYLIPCAGGYFHNIASATGVNSATYLTARASAVSNWLGISTTLPAGTVLIFPMQSIGFLE